MYQNEEILILSYAPLRCFSISHGWFYFFCRRTAASIYLTFCDLFLFLWGKSLKFLVKFVGWFFHEKKNIHWDIVTGQTRHVAQETTNCLHSDPWLVWLSIVRVNLFMLQLICPFVMLLSDYPDYPNYNDEEYKNVEVKYEKEDEFAHSNGNYEGEDE